MSRLFCSAFVALFMLACTPVESVGDAGVGSDGEAVGGSTSPLLLNRIERESFDVDTVDGVIHTELVVRSRTRLTLPRNRRLIIMIPGTLANGAGYYDIASGTGYNAAEILANEGYFVVLVDMPGTGLSYHPEDGRDTGAAVAATAVRRVALRAMARYLIVNGIDIYSETGAGTPTALLLAREWWVRSLVVTAPFYQQFGPGLGLPPPVGAGFFDPAFQAFVLANPSGYFPQDPNQIGLYFHPGTDPAIKALAIAACVGPFPQVVGTGAIVDVINNSGPDTATTWRLETPIINAEPARAPALFVSGSPDFLGDITNTTEMVAAYGSTGGGEAELTLIDGGSHLLRFDPMADGPTSTFWSIVLGYLAEN